MEKARTKNLRRVDLTPAEIDLILKACRKYRSSLPIYLESSRPELTILDDLLRKLS